MSSEWRRSLALLSSARFDAASSIFSRVSRSASVSARSFSKCCPISSRESAERAATRSFPERPGARFSAACTVSAASQRPRATGNASRSASVFPIDTLNLSHCAPASRTSARLFGTRPENSLTLSRRSSMLRECTVLDRTNPSTVTLAAARLDAWTEGARGLLLWRDRWTGSRLFRPAPAGARSARSTALDRASRGGARGDVSSPSGASAADSSVPRRVKGCASLNGSVVHTPFSF
mmetsp:Transcript_3316/g.8360  ORF Transcript_3316/g.8360 Transcript_3316/m.8360 type:complete len:236 (-) Transcript_3316:655-1362(-)